MGESGSTAKAEAQVSRMVVVMVVAFLVCWLPYALFAMIVVTKPDVYIDPVIATLPMYLTKTSTVYNPIIYIFMNRQFRDCAVPFLLCGRNPWAEPSSESATAASTSATSVTLASAPGQVSPS